MAVEGQVPGQNPGSNTGTSQQSSDKIPCSGKLYSWYFNTCRKHEQKTNIIGNSAQLSAIVFLNMGNGQVLNLPLVRVNVCVQAGTLVEPPQKAGLANLTASLLPEGTKSRTSVQISEAIDFMGASLASSGDNDFVTVTLSLLKKDIDQGFEILSDVLQNPAFIDEEVQKHKKRI